MAKQRRRTAEILAELKLLAKEADKNARRRIQLSIEVLADQDWISTSHGGSLDKAEEALKDEYFHDLGGYVTLRTLINMYEQVPESEWKEYRYNIRAIQLVYEGKYKSDKPPQSRTNWKSLYEEQLDRVEALEKELAYWKGIAEERNATIEAQRTKITDLTVEISNLKSKGRAA